MYRERKTAVLSLRLGGEQSSETIALDVQREYEFILSIDGKAYSRGIFKSPLGDLGWREAMRVMEELTQGVDNQRYYNRIYGVGVSLYDTLCETSRALESFLVSESGPRRLVIQSDRPEIHQLPWEAMLDENGESPAYGDVSIVRNADLFEPQAYISGPTLRIHGIFGPGTERQSLAALEELGQGSRGRADGGPMVSYTQENTLPDEWFDNLQADVIHMEAHGDPASGKIELPDWFNADNPVALAQRLRDRRMVLLWSCYSAMVHSWGESLAMRLHADGAAFVLSFLTPLRYKVSGQIASNFYKSVFTAHDAADPESAVVAERKRLHREDLMACDWAAMTLWLRQPMDFSQSVLNGPRLPTGAWKEEKEEETPGGQTAPFAKIFEKEVVPGRALLIPKRNLYGPLHYRLANDYRGAAVHLRQGVGGLNDGEMFEELGVKPGELKSHPGDRYITLLATLATSPKSLLVWSGVGRREVQMVDLLSSQIPRNVAVVLISPEDVGATLNVVVASDNGDDSIPTEQSTAKPAPLNKFERLYELVETDKFKEAVALWDILKDEAHTLDRAGQLRFQTSGYWSFIRQRQKDKARSCVEATEGLDPFEGLLLRGNYDHRDDRREEAKDAYAMAIQTAQASGNPVDEGRAMVELAYICSEEGDIHLSEKYYRRSIDLLENVKDELSDWRWRSAVGRVLRDFAEMMTSDAACDQLTSDPERAKQCAAYLKRALAIHSVDDRLNQVGAVLRTQGKLATLQEQWARAEASFRSAAYIFTRVGNLVGWGDTVLEIGGLSFKRGHYEQCLAIIGTSLAQMEKKYPDEYKKQRGQMALLLARAYWNSGKLGEARAHYDHSLPLLPDKDKAEATSMRDFIDSLAGGL